MRPEGVCPGTCGPAQDSGTFTGGAASPGANCAPEAQCKVLTAFPEFAFPWPPLPWCFLAFYPLSSDLSLSPACGHSTPCQPRPSGGRRVTGRALSWSQETWSVQALAGIAPSLWALLGPPLGPDPHSRPWPGCQAQGRQPSAGGQLGLLRQAPYLGRAGCEGGLLPLSSGAPLRGWHLSLPATWGGRWGLWLPCLPPSCECPVGAPPQVGLKAFPLAPVAPPPLCALGSRAGAPLQRAAALLSTCPSSRVPFCTCKLGAPARPLQNFLHSHFLRKGPGGR